jgi:hypothetical protein
MQNLTPDQRVALALITTMQQAAAAAQTFAAVAGNDTELGRAAQFSVDNQTAMVERLGELSEALAEGTVRIVDEAALVHEVARALTPAGSNWEDQVSAAQSLVLRTWKTTGVLR